MATRLPDHAGLAPVDTGMALDAAALQGNVAQRVTMLAAAGVAPERRVVLCHDDAAAMLVDVLALWQLGAVAIPASTTLIAAERHRLAARLEPVAWIAPGTDAALPVVPPAVLDPHLRSSGSTPARTVDPNALALILMTSGTTGTPKGVMLSHGALAARLTHNITTIGAAALARTLQVLPLHFGHGLIGNALTPLFAGGTVYCGMAPGIVGWSQLGAIIDRHRISFLTSVPSVWRVALRAARPPQAGSLTRVHVGSERLPPELWRQITQWSGAPVFNMYGMTETANWIGGIDGESVGFADGAVGVPWGGRFRVRREDGSTADEGRGEVLVETPSLMTGYFDDPAATAGSIQNGALATGDIGELAHDGTLRLVGRAKLQINNAGIKIAVEEVERLLEQHELVREACVYALLDAVSGEVVAAAVVVMPGADLEPADLKRWCAARIRAEAVPARITCVTELPRNTRGKVDRAALAAQLAAGRS